MDVIRHRVPFQHLDTSLLAQIPEDPTESRPQACAPMA
jgi:hypothetical protein